MERRRTRIPEILAPAGSPAAVAAAVNAGADAIYLSGKRFGARMFAGNFTDDEIRDAVDRAHFWGVHVYVTVNTLVHDRELPEVARYLCSLYRAGVDAVLVQDPGVAALAREIVPDLPLHASTQCTITDRHGLSWAKKAGFDRVVLARELSLAEIDRMLALPPDERPGIEIFAHGALCYAYSGQCLLSSVIGGRSGNRGRCAQPCRKPYGLVTSVPGREWEEILPEGKAGSYPLSTRDLCTLPLIPELAKRPFAALKIEGRMRSPEYVAIAASRYRRALDSPSAEVPEEDCEDLAVMFSRGFTRGYLAGERGQALMSRNRPENQGLYLGKIVASDRGELRVRAAAVTVPHAGDGLVAIGNEGREEIGFVLRTDAVRTGPFLIIRHETACRTGMRVFLTSSRRLDKEASAILARQGPAGRYYTVDAQLVLVPGERPSVVGEVRLPDGQVIPVSFEGETIPEPALGRPIGPADIGKNFLKTGGTPFRIGKFTLSLKGDLFMPFGAINKLRRDFLDAVKDRIIEVYRPSDAAGALAAQRLLDLRKEPGSGPGRRNPCIPDLGVICDDIKGARSALEAGCDIVYLEPAPVAWEALPAIADALSDPCFKGRIAWKWPHVVPPGFTDEALACTGEVASAGLEEIMVGSAGSADAIRRTLPAMRITGDPGLNIFNRKAVFALAPPYDGLTLSMELSGEDIRELLSGIPDNGPGISVIVQGTTEAMVTADDLSGLLPGNVLPAGGCPGLRDRTGRIFPFRTDALGRTTIFNAAELCLLDYLPDLARYGVNRILIDARWRGAAYAGRVTTAYRDALADKAWMLGGLDTGGIVDRLKSVIREAACMPLTSGPFVHGLKED